MSRRTRLRLPCLVPLNEEPQGLAELLRRFSHGENIGSFIRAQLVARAMTALAFVLAHVPELDLDEIGGGLPFAPSEGVVIMAPHYAAAEGLAINIVCLLELEDLKELTRRGGPM